ncbi:hypothetical protein [Nocardia sp. NPDC051463]|uniref:hypothetical protein n=1 Tax=Nocardia sp. NPDC051463 TaxID=3154845 RepID=UPI00344BCDFF
MASSIRPERVRRPPLFDLRPTIGAPAHRIQPHRDLSHGNTEIVATASGAGEALHGEIGVLTKKNNRLIGAVHKAIDHAIQSGTYQQAIDRWGASPKQ